jgi:serine/threonine-protein kinase
MGEVYLAADTRLRDQRVAIKIMKTSASVAKDPLIELFIREISILPTLNSPYIVKVSDWGFTPESPPHFQGTPFYVMEYLEGETLGTRLSKLGKLPKEQAVMIISQICEGLKVAHQQGIIHRDLKPDNIFLIPGGPRGDFVKILDFGIAKIKRGEYAKSAAATVGFRGTYRYASPEQCRELPVDERADIYSLGMVFYEMLSGTNPFGLEPETASGFDWCDHHINGRAKPLRMLPGCENIPLDLQALVMKCLATKPDLRFAKVEALEQALKAVLPEIC